PASYTLSLHDALPISEVADPFDLLLRSRLGHEDRALDAELLAGAGEALCVVACRGAHDSACPLVRIELEHEVEGPADLVGPHHLDRKSTRLNSSHVSI